MHIKEIIIDGFKSYAVKTTITAFDRHFNAITGFNGSGKSNIFDAICFWLGISSWSHVRASNLQDLIYKKGNAGVNKASVSIIFDNKDKKTSPWGCEEHDEIIVSRTIYQGKSKYYLNGYTATQDNIRTLFQSVSLNINNPHFLIMQGKIRQVVNMKPIEILGLLEEAAGTSVYQSKKESSLKMIKKKENKLDEITKLLHDEISPQWEKWMKDKQNYLTWKSKENEINRINKILTAFTYYETTKIAHVIGSEQWQYKVQYDEMVSNANNLFPEIKNLNEKITEKVNEWNSVVDEAWLKQYKECWGLLKADKHKIETINKGIIDSEKEITRAIEKNEKIKLWIEASQKDKKNWLSNVEMFEKDYQNKKDYLKELEMNVDNFNSGKTEAIGQWNINKWISDAQSNKNKSSLEKKNLVQQISFISEDIKSKKLQLNEFKSKLKQCESQLGSFNIQINQTEKEWSGLTSSKFIRSHAGDGSGSSSNNNNMIEAIQQQIRNKENSLAMLERQQNEILNKYASRVEVQFRDPEPNFDRKKVKGRIIRMFSLEDDKYTRAIEQIAGGKWYNIIVDTENTASLLLSRKCFDYGVTMIPSNKIMQKPIPQDKLNWIEKVSNGEAKLALDVIKFDSQYTQAMKFVFGSTFICPTTEIAKKLAYSDNIKVKCVNWDGDVFDPVGILTGGAQFRQDSILKKVVELTQIQGKIKEERNGVTDLKRELEEILGNQKKIFDLQTKLDSLRRQSSEYDKDLISEKIAQIENELSKLTELIKRHELRIEEWNEFEKKYTDELKKLQGEQNEFMEMANSSKRKDMYQKKITSTKSNLLAFEKNINNIKTNINDTDYKISQMSSEIKDNEDFIINERNNIEISKKKK